VYSPQLLENYTRQSGEGLSVLFVVTWLLGDITNLIGGLLGGLLPTVILLALYYTICDTTLLFQIYYYRRKRSRSAFRAHSSNLQDRETDPLLDGDEITEGILPLRVLAMRYLAALVFVITVGLVAWWITYDDKAGLAPPALDEKKWWLIQALGWTSALLFLGARVPQIVKNFHTRCEGLSPALFFFAIIGNITYAWSICAKSMDINYLIRNAGWLAGSTFTIILDVLVLCQFCYYRYNDKIEARNDTISNE